MRSLKQAFAFSLAAQNLQIRGVKINKSDIFSLLKADMLGSVSYFSVFYFYGRRSNIKLASLVELGLLKKTDKSRHRLTPAGMDLLSQVEKKMRTIKRNGYKRIKKAI